MDNLSIVKKLLNAAKIENQKLVILTDNCELALGKLFFEAGKEITETKMFNLDDYGKRPLENCPSEIILAVQNSDLLISLISKVSNNDINEAVTIRKPILALKQNNAKLRIGQLLDTSEEEFSEIFLYNPDEIKELNSKLFELIKNSQKIHIITPAGTDFSCSANKDTLWINQDADLSKPSPQHSLLAGEVYGVPKNCNGKIVVDGVLGGEFMRFGLLDKNPLIIIVENDLIKSFSCENKELENAFGKHLKKYENANRIGELGFGTNFSLKKLYGVLGIDEKFPGNHIAFGHPYSEKTGATWSSETHIDAVLKNCSTWIDDLQVLKDGKYVV